MTELAVSPGGRRYGAHRSILDVRDFDIKRFRAYLASISAPIPTKLPPSTNNRQFCGPVRDQGDEGSCTGHAGRGMRIFLANKFQGNANAVDFSPADIYYLSRQMDGSLTDGDCGSTGRTVVRVLNQFGASPEGDDPYVAGQISTPPSAQALTDGLKYKSGAYHGLMSVADMKSCHASGYAFIVGFTVYNSFEGSEIAQTGLMPVPDKANEQVLGGHEVLFVDYDDTVECTGAIAPGAFLVQNSWGTGWAKEGFFWFPYQCASDQDVLMDAFIQHLGRPW